MHMEIDHKHFHYADIYELEALTSIMHRHVVVRPWTLSCKRGRQLSRRKQTKL